MNQVGVMKCSEAGSLGGPTDPAGGTEEEL